MDEGRFSVSASSPYDGLGTAAAPMLIDVRRTPTFDADEWMIVSAICRPPDTVGEWRTTLPKNRPVIVYCSHRLEIGRDTAECRSYPRNETVAIN